MAAELVANDMMLVIDNLSDMPDAFDLLRARHILMSRQDVVFRWTINTRGNDDHHLMGSVVFRDLRGRRPDAAVAISIDRANNVIILDRHHVTVEIIHPSVYLINQFCAVDRASGIDLDKLARSLHWSDNILIEGGRLQDYPMVPGGITRMLMEWQPVKPVAVTSDVEDALFKLFGPTRGKSILRKANKV